VPRLHQVAYAEFASLPENKQQDDRRPGMVPDVVTYTYDRGQNMNMIGHSMQAHIVAPVANKLSG
jgi:hypothetical protein